MSRTRMFVLIDYERLNGRWSVHGRCRRKKVQFTFAISSPDEFLWMTVVKFYVMLCIQLQLTFHQTVFHNFTNVLLYYFCTKTLI